MSTSIGLTNVIAKQEWLKPAEELDFSYLAAGIGGAQITGHGFSTVIFDDLLDYDTGVHVCPELDEWERRHGLW